MLDVEERYLITQSLISAWAYQFDCFEGSEEDAKASFLRTLRREPSETTEAMQNGIDFETEVYRAAVGAAPTRYEWRYGVNAVASRLRGAQIQVKASREITVDGMTFVVYGILDALGAGVISDVKFKNKRFGSIELAGSYRESPQHPLYFYIVPEAYRFDYLVSDGEDLYVETYRPNECRSAEEIIRQFIRSIKGDGLLDVYLEHWKAK